MNDKKRKEFECRKLTPGRAGGEALVSSADICFYMTDPGTGEFTEDGHPIQGHNVAGKVVIFPSGKGSSCVQTDGLYQLHLKNNAPAAFIVQYADTVLVASAILMEIPMVHRLPDEFYATVKSGDLLEVDAENGKVSILREDIS